MSYRFNAQTLVMAACCAIAMGVVMVVPGILGWDVNLDVQMFLAAALLVMLVFLTYRR